MQRFMTNENMKNNTTETYDTETYDTETCTTETCTTETCTTENKNEAKSRLEQQMNFCFEIDKEKMITRQTYRSDGNSKENDAEHAWHMAIMTILLSEYANEEIDVLKTVTMLLIHDLVEIDAGDTYAYDEAAKLTQRDRELAAADRIYSLLPQDQGRKLRALWDEFEEQATPEAKFARTMDNLQPLMLNAGTNGKSWRERGIALSQILGRNKNTAKGSEKLWEYAYEHFIEPNVRKGNIKRDVVISKEQMSQNQGGCFDGWGSSLCWWANRVGYSDELSQACADLFYGDDGLRLNIMRYNIGGGDDPAHHHITRTDSAMPGWLVSKDTTISDEKTSAYNQEFIYNKDFIYDVQADRRQLNVLKRTFEAAGENAFVEVFSNSAPYFMTISGCSSGAINASDNNLKEEDYEAFAEYLAYVAKYIEKELKIPVSTISPMNEPNTDFWPAYSSKQEGCHFDPGAAQSRILVETKKAMIRHGLSHTALCASDETNPRKQLIACNSYSDEAWKVIDRINTHTYQEDGIQDLGKLAKEKGFTLCMSEVDGGGIAGEDAGEMATALWFADKIISDLNALSPCGWVMWQLIDSHISAEGMNGNKDFGMIQPEKGYWGVAVADHDKKEVILTQKYYAFGQFSRYIRPKDTLIHCGEKIIAAYSSTRKEIVIVAVNDSANEQPLKVRFDGFHMVRETDMCRVTAVRTSGSIACGEHWKELPETSFAFTEGVFETKLKSNSITTFQIHGYYSRCKYLIKDFRSN